MAAVRLIALHGNKGKTVAQTLSDRTDYAKNPDKTAKGELVTSYGCDPLTVDEEFMLSKRQYRQITGREQHSDVIAYQIRQSFKPGEISPEKANRLGHELAMRFTKGHYAFIVATHTDRSHIHNHIIFNSTAMDGTRKFRNFYLSGIALQRVSDLICLENGLSVITPKPYSERENRSSFTHRTKHRDVLCNVIDEILSSEGKPKTFEEFLKAFEAAGYEIKRGKNISVRGKDQQRFIRLSSLDEEYQEATLRAVLDGKTVRTAKKGVKSNESISLIVDVQEKLAKGGGYGAWARRHNAKQLWNSLYYARTHGADTLEELNKSAEECIAKRDELLKSIRAAETRIEEIKILRKHIISYSKTRPIYEAYRKAGYSSKSLNEHREEIAIHKAAKKAFDELGASSIPKIKDLNEEYTRLLSDKKQKYAEFRRARDEARQLLIAKENVVSFYASENQEERKKEKKERVH